MSPPAPSPLWASRRHPAGQGLHVACVLSSTFDLLTVPFVPSPNLELSQLLRPLLLRPLSSGSLLTLRLRRLRHLLLLFRVCARAQHFSPGSHMIVRTRRPLRVPGTPLGPHGFTAGRLPRHGPLHGLLRAPRRLGLPGGISRRVLRAGRAVRAGRVLALLVHGSRAEVPPASAHASRRPCLCACLHVVRVRSNVCSL